MEVFLLWLDDLDDVLFSVALVWERLRRAVLQIGLAAAFALAGSELSAIATHWWPAFTGIAAGSVGAWLLGTTLRVVYRRRREDSLAAA
jgi:CHASE2 domain-containing sensor protein